jgi:hypothetical protein
MASEVRRAMVIPATTSSPAAAAVVMQPRTMAVVHPRRRPRMTSRAAQRANPAITAATTSTGTMKSRTYP